MVKNCKHFMHISNSQSALTFSDVPFEEEELRFQAGFDGDVFD